MHNSLLLALTSFVLIVPSTSFSQVTIVVPAGSSNACGYAPPNQPGGCVASLQSINNADATFTTVLDSLSSNGPDGWGAGILLYQDDQNFILFKISEVSGTAYSSCFVISQGSATQVVSSLMLNLGAQEALQVVRSGSTFTFYASSDDGNTYSPVGSFSQAISLNQGGVYISNFGANPPLASANIEFFNVSYGSPPRGATINVDGTTIYQTMDGFGGENGGPWSWAVGNTLTSHQADMLFSASAGIGISIYRTDNTNGNSFPDIQAMQQAVARGASVQLTMAGPPASLRWTGNFSDGSMGPNGSCAKNFPAYASYIVGLIQRLNSNRIPVTFLDVQNEPDDTSPGGNGFSRCNWTPQALDTFVQTLAPTLSNAGLSPKIILGNAIAFSTSAFFDTCVNDSACAPYLSIVSAHGYGGWPDTSVYYGTPISMGLHVWMGETADPNSFDPSMSSAIVLAQSMNDFTVVANVSSYNYWELAYTNTRPGCQNCSLVDQTFSPTMRYYVFGNWSKYVRPGWVRIGATAHPTAGVSVSAFMDPSTHNYAIVAVNQNGFSTSVGFTLNGLSGAPVTPAVTSAGSGLVDHGSMSTGGGFSYTLPAQSVVTFHSP